MSILFSCKHQKSPKELFLRNRIPTYTPISFHLDTIPKNKIIHKAILSPDYESYYFVLSNPDFTNFDIYVSQKEDNVWGSPQKAFFNTTYDEHGISFSSDGNTIYFSFTRPVEQAGISDTWHLWKSEKVNKKWETPTFIDIPNLKDKLVSHPSITNDGTLYFHSSNPDYSEMYLYHAKLEENGQLQDAQKINFPNKDTLNKCTPFIAPNGKYLIYATVGNQLNLWISFQQEGNQWSTPQEFNELINKNGQGNPFVTTDHKYLFFTVEKNGVWEVKWVNIEDQLGK